MQGIAFEIDGLSEKICERAFSKGLIMETSGTDSEVAKIMPPLTIDESGLMKGLDILRKSIEEIAADIQ
ncbi:Diaminobutyrate--2-oxoglutarate transaminase [compost metagenome]